MQVQINPFKYWIDPYSLNQNNLPFISVTKGLSISEQESFNLSIIFWYWSLLSSLSPCQISKRHSGFLFCRTESFKRGLLLDNNICFTVFRFKNPTLVNKNI